MLIWTPKAVEVLRDATAKAENMNHREVHPLHLLWALTGRSGLEALRFGRSDQQQARIRFQVERELNKMPVIDRTDGGARGEYSSPGLRLQHLLLRAADFSTGNRPKTEKGRVGQEELLKALVPDDHRAASLLRAHEEVHRASA